jgi:hypothetical protein
LQSLLPNEIQTEHGKEVPVTRQRLGQMEGYDELKETTNDLSLEILAKSSK